MNITYVLFWLKSEQKWLFATFGSESKLHKFFCRDPRADRKTSTEDFSIESSVRRNDLLCTSDMVHSNT